MFNIRRKMKAILARILIPVASLLIATMPITAWAQERVALVIGNGGYQNAGQLPNARNDGSDMIDLLERMEFDVIGGIDLGYDDMNRMIRQFADRAENAEIALVFFAGHGVQADGLNYLIPVDAKLATDRDLTFQAIDMSILMVALERSRFGIIMLDACRNNPFVSRMAQANPFRNLRSGLARVDAQMRSNLLVSYSTHPGGLAEDGDSVTGNSPYTSALLKYLPADMDIYRVFAHVTDEVRTNTQGKQNPWIEGMPPLDEIRLAAGSTMERSLVPEEVPSCPAGCGVVTVIEEETATAHPTSQSSGGSVNPLPGAPFVTRCDELAANPSDENKLPSVTGISKSHILSELAIPACQQAVANSPDVPRLQFQLGRALESAGRYTEAHAAYLAAAEHDYAPALTNIGDMLRDGLGMEQNLATAFRWYLRAANLGSQVAYWRVGNAYTLGLGVEQDYHKASNWFLPLAEKGERIAMRWIGRYYLLATSKGGNDAERGINWLKQAAALGDTDAMFSLGEYYYFNLAMPLFYSGNREREEEMLRLAESWLLKAGGHNHSLAEQILGFIEERRAGI